MKIGTLSFEVFGKGPNFRLSSNARADTIIDLVGCRDLDLLVCAGHTVGRDKDVRMVADRLSRLSARTHVVLEAKESEQSPKYLREFDIAQQKKKKPDEKPRPRTHGIFLLRPSADPVPLGPQWFGSANELEGTEGAWRSAHYVAKLDQKTKQTELGCVFAICCGEISLLEAPKQGKRKGSPDVVAPRRRIPEPVINGLGAADLIVNPTHDQMGYPGLLDNKRRWLSQRASSGETRAYVSVSNWNTEKRGQNPRSRDLHAVYVSGQRWGERHSPIQLSEDDYLAGQGTLFEYREWKVSL